ERVGAALIDDAGSRYGICGVASVWSACRKTIGRDVSLRQSAGVLALLKRVPDDKLKTRSLGDAAVSCSSCTASIQLLDPAKTEQIIDDAFGNPTAGRLAAQRLVAAGVTP